MIVINNKVQQRIDKAKQSLLHHPDHFLHHGDCQHRLDVVMNYFYDPASVESPQTYSPVVFSDKCTQPYLCLSFQSVFLEVGLYIVHWHHEECVREAYQNADQEQLTIIKLVLLGSFSVVPVDQFLQVFLSTQKTDPAQQLPTDHRDEPIKQTFQGTYLPKSGIVGVGIRCHEPNFDSLEGTDNNRLNYSCDHPSSSASHADAPSLLLKFVPELVNQEY